MKRKKLNRVRLFIDSDFYIISSIIELWEENEDRNYNRIQYLRLFFVILRSEMTSEELQTAKEIARPIIAQYVADDKGEHPCYKEVYDADSFDKMGRQK